MKSCPISSLTDLAQAAFGFRPDPAMLDWYLKEMARTKAILDEARRAHPRLSDTAPSDFARMLQDEGTL